MNHEYHKNVLMIRLKGGLCNRVLALISGILWAEDLDRRLAIYWPVAENMPHSIEKFLNPDSIQKVCCVHNGYLTNAHSVNNKMEMETVLQIFGNSEEIRIESYSQFHPDARGVRGIAILNSIKWETMPDIKMQHIIGLEYN